MASVQLFDSILNRSDPFELSLPFVLMILMTMRTHHDVIFYLLGSVNLTAWQKKNLILACWQVRTFFILTSTSKKRIFLNGIRLPRFRERYFYVFLQRACWNMLKRSESCYNAGSMEHSFKWWNKFYCNGISIPSLEMLQDTVKELPVSMFLKYGRIERYRLERFKTATLLLQMVDLLRENQNIFSFLRIKGSPERLFRIWKKMVYIGCSDRVPHDSDYHLLRNPDDIIFLLVIFISLNDSLIEKLTYFVKTMNDPRKPIPIDCSILKEMIKILHNECRSSEGLGDLQKLLQEPEKRLGPRNLCDFIEVLPILQHKVFWDLSFHYVLLAKESSPLLVNKKSLDLQYIFARFHQCFCLFLENLPQNLLPIH